jgi:hypothetical protein
VLGPSTLSLLSVRAMLWRASKKTFVVFITPHFECIHPHYFVARRLDLVLDEIAREDCSQLHDAAARAATSLAPISDSAAPSDLACKRAQQARPLSPSFQRRPLSAFVDRMPRAISSSGITAGARTQSATREPKYFAAQRSPSPLVPAPASPRLVRANSPQSSPATSRFEEFHRGAERAAFVCMKPLVPVDVMGVGARMADQKSKQFQDRLRLMGL